MLFGMEVMTQLKRSSQGFVKNIIGLIEFDEFGRRFPRLIGRSHSKSSG